MTEFEIVEGMYLWPTPAGAYDAVAGKASRFSQRFILNTLRHNQSPALDIDTLVQISGLPPDQAMSYLYQMQSLNLMQGLDAPRHLPAGNLETLLPGVLAEIAGSNRALLADGQGFYLASHGYHHETAEELAALSADISTMHQRHQGLIAGNLSLRSAAWALISDGGNSEIGFWPLTVGEHRFVLILTGLPHLNRPATVDLVWLLVNRYGQLDVQNDP